ncbi:MFS transporter [Tomitella fengzijianii]|uniref:MFS transporter n=1 Tax=Tomitella fengzijianii TaxID=2597660 RepID=A0A516X4G0_9ACTN|nr:MFS transporter [Tomitella fengzijianii]QDQ97944.1 MFS transporter [Tomitella fengzijianii]
MTAPTQQTRRQSRAERDTGKPHYKWIVLSNTTLGSLIATINSSILLIALPDIFRGLGVNPLEPGNTSLLLWLIMGYLVVTAVLVVSFGRLGDMFGRVRMYNAGFAVFTLFSVMLSVTWMGGTAGAWWLIVMRVLQGVGGAMLMANSSAIITDVFPTNQRGLALGLNAVTAIAGSFIGLVLGGVLAPISWRLVFLVSVPIGLFGTVWAYLRLHDTGVRQRTKLDPWGNLTFAAGLIAVLVGITYGIQPYGGHTMGWTNPWVLTALIGGGVVLGIFCLIETKVDEPMFRLGLFRIRAFTAGNLASLLSALGRGGLMFILIIWLQGIWLPQHGYSFESTPLWAGIYMVPMTIGFLVAGPVSGWLSDRFGARLFATGGMVIAAATFVLLMVLPVDFVYWQFAVILLVNGLGMGLFAAPNRAGIMNSLPPNRRGVGAGMSTTFQNAAMVLSIGIFFSLIITGLSHSLPDTLSSGLIAQGVPVPKAEQIAALPPVAVLFASLLGYNPIGSLLGNDVLAQLPPGNAEYLTGRSFFPQLISGPFADGLAVAFGFAIVACLIAAIASWLRGGQYVYSEPKTETILPGGPGATAEAAANGAGEPGNTLGGHAGTVPVADGVDVTRIESAGHESPAARSSPTL